MDQIQPIPKYRLKFVVMKDNKPIEFKTSFTIPSVQQPPLPNDEVQLPKDMVSSVGVNKTTFKVEGRRFLFDSLEPGFAAIVYLHIS